jgi:hypothetical protein
MAVDKLSVSFEPELGEAIREAAEAEDATVSAWLAEAARDRLRNLALGVALDELIAETGLTEEELAAAGAEARTRAVTTGPELRRQQTA